MPDLLYQPSNAAAARIIAALRDVPGPDGTVPAANATNAQLWQHCRAVIGQYIKSIVKSREANMPDADLDKLG